MLPCRPLPGPRACLRAAACIWPRGRPLAPALALVLLLAPAARAFQLTAIRPVRDASGQLWVELRIEEPIEARVAGSLGRGMPATLTLHAELWRRRTAWFDRMERAVDASFRIRYDVWSDRWRLDGPGGSTLSVSTLDSLAGALQRTLALPVAPLGHIGQDVPCYVVVSASLRPLNVEDVEEVEAWLSGAVKKKRSGLSLLTSLPHSLFEAARNFAGFGDEHSRLISTEFTPANLPAVSRQ